MLIITIRINRVLTAVYAVAMLIMLSIAAYNLVPVVYYVKGLGWTICTAAMFVFSYMAYLAGLIKERREL